MRLARHIAMAVLILAMIPVTLPSTPLSADMPCCAGDSSPCSPASWQGPLMDCCRPQPGTPAAPAPQAGPQELAARPLVACSTTLVPPPPALPAALQRPAPAGGILSRSLLSRHVVLLI